MACKWLLYKLKIWTIYEVIINLILKNQLWYWWNFLNFHILFDEKFNQFYVDLIFASLKGKSWFSQSINYFKNLSHESLPSPSGNRWSNWIFIRFKCFLEILEIYSQKLCVFSEVLHKKILLFAFLWDDILIKSRILGSPLISKLSKVFPLLPGIQFYIQ